MLVLNLLCGTGTEIFMHGGEKMKQTYQSKPPETSFVHTTLHDKECAV